MRIIAKGAATALLFGVASAAAQGLPTARPDQLGFSAERFDRLGRVLQEYVDSGRVAGVVALVARHGRVAYLRAVGWADREAGRRMTPDALFRIASQTKAITSVAVMALLEDGKLRLGDPVSKFLLSFAAARVAVAAPTGRQLVAAKQPITIRHLLTHTAGISYGTDALVQDLYRAEGLGPAAGFGWYFADKAEPICTTMDRLGALPFVAQPGERWVYGYATDVLGCVVERASGQTLAAFLEARLFRPLRMVDTRFFVPPTDRARLTAVYAATAGGGLERAPAGPQGQGDYADGPRQSFSGGAGLVSTAGDYARFLQMLLNGGELDGVRVLSPRTVAVMIADHADTLYSRFAPGRGFGLGFEVLEDPGLAGQYGSPGLYSWGGAYNTAYWVDPAEDLVAVLMVQRLPWGLVELADKFRTLVYQAIVETESGRPRSARPP